MSLMYTCGSCGRKIADEELKKTHIARQGYFCPYCGEKKDGRTWKKRKVVNYAVLPVDKEESIIERIKDGIRSKQRARRQEEGLLI